MGLLNGRAGFVRFSVDGDLPENPWEFIAERIALFSFQDIDENYEESSIGWVSPYNMFDSQFHYGSYACANYITLSLRFDERRVSSTILKKFVLKEEERIKREKQIPKIGKTAKTEIKERIKSELTRKALPFPSVYDLVWNLSDSVVLFFSTNSKAHVLLEDYFKTSFGLTLIQQVPYTTAQHLLESEALAGLQEITPDVLI